MVCRVLQCLHSFAFIKHCLLLIYLGLLSFSFVWIRNFDIWLRNAQYAFPFHFFMRAWNPRLSIHLVSRWVIPSVCIPSSQPLTAASKFGGIQNSMTDVVDNSWSPTVHQCQNPQREPCECCYLGFEFAGDKNPKSLTFSSGDGLRAAACTDCPWRRLRARISSTFSEEASNTYSSSSLTSAIKQEKLQVSTNAQI